MKCSIDTSAPEFSLNEAKENINGGIRTDLNLGMEMNLSQSTVYGRVVDHPSS